MSFTFQHRTTLYYLANYSFCCFFVFFFFSSFSFCFKKYSPLSSCKSILDGCCGGGNGVYSFFSFFFSTFFFGFFTCLFLKCGKKRSQFSLASLGSLANSRLIMSSYTHRFRMSCCIFVIHCRFYLDVINRVYVFHAVQDYPANFFQAFVRSHCRYGVALNEHVAFCQQFNRFQSVAVRTNKSLSSLDKSCLISSNASNFDDIACYIVLHNFNCLAERYTSR